jgi:hypothetical protein
MAKGQKTGGKDFKPGESGNPNGRPTIPEDIKQARKLNRTELERILNEFCSLSLVDLKARVESKTANVLEVLIGKILAEGIRKGDERRLDFILSRIPSIGPMRQKISLDGGEDKNGEPEPLQIELKERIAQLTAGKPLKKGKKK